MSARLDDNIKERIREANDILEVVEQCVPLKKAGSNFKACCPFHEEKTPSFNVNPAKQIWHCFGCGAGGDAFAFVMQYHGMSFPEALRYLANRVGMSLPEERERPGEVGRADMLAVNAQYAAWYQEILLRSPEGEPARAYLQGRGIHVDLAREFGFGYAPDDWTAARSALSDLDATHVVAAGLAKSRQDGSLYDLFRNRIIFPICGSSGDIIAFGGRALGDDPAKYINSPETAVYRKGAQLYNLHRARRAIQEAGRAILVEGYFDAVRLAAEGFPETVATCGTALTPQQAKVLSRHTPRVVVAYDGDPAGSAAAERAAAHLLAAGLDVGFVALPGGQDPDDFLRAHGRDAFGKLVATARDFVDFILLDTERARNLPIEPRVAYADRLAALAAQISHPTRQRLYREKIAKTAERLAVDPEDLRRPLSRPAGERAEMPPTEAPVRLREGERELLRVVLSNLPNLAQFDGLEEACATVSAPVAALVHRALIADPPYASVAALGQGAASEPEQQILRELDFEPEDQRRYPPEWWHHHMKRRMAQYELARVRRELAEAENRGDHARVAQLGADFVALRARKQQSTEACLAAEVEN